MVHHPGARSHQTSGHKTRDPLASLSSTHDFPRTPTVWVRLELMAFNPLQSQFYFFCIGLKYLLLLNIISFLLCIVYDVVWGVSMRRMLNPKCLPQPLSTLCFETGSLTETGAC